MTVTLALAVALWDELCAALDDERETAGVIAARAADPATYLARRLTWAPPETYLNRHACGLELGSPGWVPATRAALAEGSVPVFIHTHPRGRPFFSAHDDAVDASLTAALPGMGGTGQYLALVVAGTRQAATAAARLYVNGDDAVPVDKIRVSGDAIKVITRHHHGADPASPMRPSTARSACSAPLASAPSARSASPSSGPAAPVGCQNMARSCDLR